MKIALINPPHPYLVQPNAQAPLGLAYLSAMIKKYKSDVKVDILNYSHKTVEEVVEEIEVYDVYGYTATVVDYYTCENLAKKIYNKYTGCHIIGGSHATLSYNTINQNVFDSIFIGEAEYSLLQFIDDYKNNNIKEKYFGEKTNDLDSLPFPDRKALGEHQGGKIFIDDDSESTVIMGSRGCPYGCYFCASDQMWSRKVRWRNVDNLVEEIVDVKNKLGIRNFRFSDDNMTSKRSRLIEFCEKTKSLNINWRLSARVDSLDSALLDCMREAGCREISLGVESFDINVLNAMNKKITPEKSVEAIKLCKAHNIKTRILFMISTPGETYKHTISENIRYIEQIKNDFDLISLKILVPLPGTFIWDNEEKCKIKIINKDFRNFNFYMYEKKDKKIVERPVYSNIKIDGMRRDEQLKNIKEMRKYIASLKQNNRG